MPNSRGNGNGCEPVSDWLTVAIIVGLLGGLTAIVLSVIALLMD